VPELIRCLLRHRARSTLTVLAIAVGVFAVTAVGGIAEYLDILVVRPAVENARGRVRVAPKQWEQPLTQASLRQLRRIEGVAGVTAQTHRTVYLQDGQVVREERWA
jgi:ABC-type lipoprotein release transport system permease subunit